MVIKYGKLDFYSVNSFDFEPSTLANSSNMATASI